MGYLEESTFWYFIGHQLWHQTTDTVGVLINALNIRAKALDLPVEWSFSQCIPWAVCCRSYVLFKKYDPLITKAVFNAFQRGMSVSMGPHDFFDHAFRRIVGNVAQQAFPGRTAMDSVADTFVLASMKYVLPNIEAEQLHTQVTETVITDKLIHEASVRACTLNAAFFEKSLNDYAERRPGWFRRYFTNADKWLFSKKH